jgi:hypothetical protein
VPVSTVGRMLIAKGIAALGKKRGEPN